jgi:hypothetical protein
VQGCWWVCTSSEVGGDVHVLEKVRRLIVCTLHV